MKSLNIVNVINFVRGCEPREEADLVTPVLKELELCGKYKIPGTFLLQYDALLRDDITEVFLNSDNKSIEKGIWIEIVKPLCDAVGIPWRGRYDWDWYVDPGFLQSYTKEQKTALLDELMRFFKEKFGEYPKVAGSWLFDSFSMQYLNDKYGMHAYTICRDQSGTDGYTLWGGYYNGGYYPSKNNMYIPAYDKSNQIDVPVFRMLSPDPIYQYYEKLDNQAEINKNDCLLYTLEPAWGEGQNPKAVDWYFENVMGKDSFGLCYAQIGQENSFSWELSKEGLPYQMEEISRLRSKGIAEIKTLGETGQIFKETYSVTPPTLESALNDWAGNGMQSVWYCCKNYRVNLYNDGKKIYIRDIHLYGDDIVDLYLSDPCTQSHAEYRALPILDGFHGVQDNKELPGIFFGNGRIIGTYEEEGYHIVSINAENAAFTLKFTESGFSVESTEKTEFSLKENIRVGAYAEIAISENYISGKMQGTVYSVKVKCGKFKDGAIFSDKNGIIEISCNGDNI